MQHLEIPYDQFAKLTERALAAGFENVSSLLGALAAEPSEDPRGPHSEAELRASAADCDRIDKAMQAGAERNAHVALQELGKEFGLQTPA